MIEIPENIEEILHEDYQPPNESDEEEEVGPYQLPMNERLLERRRKQFSEELVATCYDYYAEQNPEKAYDDTQSIYKWPSNFDIDTVPEVAEHPLRERPEIKVTQTMQDFLSRRSNNDDMSDVSSIKSYNSQASEVLSQSGVQESTINRIA